MQIHGMHSHPDVIVMIPTHSCVILNMKLAVVVHAIWAGLGQQAFCTSLVILLRMAAHDNLCVDRYLNAAAFEDSTEQVLAP